MDFTEVNILEYSDMYYRGTCLADEMPANFHVSFIRKEDSLHLWARIDGVDSSERWNTGEPVNWVFELSVAIEVVKCQDLEEALPKIENFMKSVVKCCDKVA